MSKHNNTPPSIDAREFLSNYMNQFSNPAEANSHDAFTAYNAALQKAGEEYYCPTCHFNRQPGQPITKDNPCQDKPKWVLGPYLKQLHPCTPCVNYKQAYFWLGKG